MKKTDDHTKGYNEKNPVQPQGSVEPDKNDDKKTYLENTSPNEKKSIPERKLKGDKK